MAQNIYDRPEFFARYSQLARSVHGLAGAPEWPAVRALLPDLAGKRIVDLGCGFGWFARWARAQGAAHVLGIDLSENMIARAMADNHHSHWTSLNSAAPLGAAAMLGEEVSALQTLVDILSRSNEVGCEPCGGSGVKGRGLCERCRGRGTLLRPAAVHSRF